jgi:nucleoside-diphosphate-sugar epimerase
MQQLDQEKTVALIGYTGLVGSNLSRKIKCDAFYNSTNIEAIIGKRFDYIVCAGARGTKWKANAAPEEDRASIVRLCSALTQARAGKIILISTIDVFPEPINVDETTPTEHTDYFSYGRNRLWLEEQITRRFPTLTLRLPGLYGEGLKKNPIYDLLHSRRLEHIDARSEYQFYNLGRLGSDIQIALANDLPVIHPVTEPITMGEVAREAFDTQLHCLPEPHVQYAVRTRHAALLGGAGDYIETRGQVLSGIKRFAALNSCLR